MQKNHKFTKVNPQTPAHCVDAKNRKNCVTAEEAQDAMLESTCCEKRKAVSNRVIKGLEINKRVNNISELKT